MDVAGSSARSSHFVLFDAMRAIAVLCVVGLHVGHYSGVNLRAAYGAYTSHLGLGVTLFFLISGFLLYRPHAVALLGGPPAPGIRIYAWRRVLRIVPAYWVALTLLGLWPGLEGVFGSDWWIYYGFGQAYDLTRIFRGIPAAWSLTVEVGFYAALPLLAWLLARIGRQQSPERRAIRAFAGIAALGIAGEVARISLRDVAPSLPFTYPGLLLDFSFGMALALFSASVGAREREHWLSRFVGDRPGLCWAAALALYVAVFSIPIFPRGFGMRHTTTSFALEHAVSVGVAALLLLPAVFGETRGGWPRRLLGTRLFEWLGLVSYGVFLWHQPLLAYLAREGVAQWVPGWPFLSLALAIAPLALAAGAASYYLVERPAMQLRGARRG